MTNKTINLDHSAAERLVSAVDNGALFRPEDLEAFRAALAEPVPPAGGEPAVLGWRVTSVVPCVFLEQPGDWSDDYTVTELVDRAHVTRLQAEVEEWKALSVTRIMLDVVPGDGDGHEVYAKSVAEVEECLGGMGDQIEDLQIDKVNLQSELTKARDALLKILHASEWTRDDAHYREVAQTIAEKATANQSAPADKGTPDDCAHSEANNRGCPECGKEFKCAPALIKTLHANGDRIAMEATIAQQAQRIADLEADKVTK